jgi:ribonucleotide reductase alpha subunit
MAERERKARPGFVLVTHPDIESDEPGEVSARAYESTYKAKGWKLVTAGLADDELASKTKAELVDYARENHQLDLNPKATHADLVAAIVAARSPSEPEIPTDEEQ